MKFFRFNTNGFRGVRLMLWSMLDPHYHVRNPALWKMNMVEWHLAMVKGEIRESIK
jgi:hypothetical protein